MQIGDYALNCYEDIDTEAIEEIKLRKLTKEEFIKKFTNDKGIRKESKE